ncbi:hypothetical protein EG327_003202 [Venturia inaequalis]|uniref:PLC-like phosphodiesterase n=1 Tax=Venturia inaequalis TaxID=5025 RepID=A0A8H3Z7X2_VENIN|nr:hypothetical protein EG327_003202 [Venturia inaequalis]
MPSKGIQLYTFIGIGKCQISYTVPGFSIIREQPGTYNDHLEVDKAQIQGLFNFVGRFQFNVSVNGKAITSQYVDINTLTGNMESGTMKSNVDQRSVVTNELVVTYGLYDAGQGQAGLPKSDQCYVTVTKNQSNWQGTMAPAGSTQEKSPFSLFVLPSAHDIGMNSMETADLLLQKAATPFLGVLKSVEVINTVANLMSDAILLGIAPNIIRSLAITQKDSLPAILAIGARYFEFRPAHLHKAVLTNAQIPDRLYFMHGPIPGMAFDHFLYDCIAFLMAHPLEIIVIQLRWDGVPAECARPSDEELAEYIRTALQSSNNTIITGSLDDMTKLSTHDLRNQRKRLILFKEVSVLSTYDDASNATLNGDSIIAAFNRRLSTAAEDGKALVNLQCQATASNIKEVVVYSAVTANVSNSCLMSTKGICDSKTLPWIDRYALDRLQASGKPIVVMNDFIDGHTVEVGIVLSQRRLGSYKK